MRDKENRVDSVREKGVKLAMFLYDTRGALTKFLVYNEYCVSSMRETPGIEILNSEDKTQRRVTDEHVEY